MAKPLGGIRRSARASPLVKRSLEMHLPGQALHRHGAPEAPLILGQLFLGTVWH